MFIVTAMAALTFDAFMKAISTQNEAREKERAADLALRSQERNEELALRSQERN